MPGMCAVRKGFFSRAMSGPPGRADNDRVVFKFSAIIEATADDAERAAEAMQRALCPDENHDGPCQVPWTMTQCRFEDLDDDERAMWEKDFANDRRP